MDCPRLFAAGSCALLVVASACTAYRYQHLPTPPAAPVQQRTATPPDAEFRGLDSSQQLAQVRGESAELKARLDAEGKYSCCVEPACDLCLLTRGECHCHQEVKQDGPCGECTTAWAEGRGAVPGVDAWDILMRKLRALERPEPATGEAAPPR